MDYRTTSPTSSFTSELPSEDISDFSDSEFDIISSSGSAKSHEREDAASVNNMEVEDEEGFQVAALEPFMFPGTDWLGVTTSTGAPNHVVIRPPGVAAPQPLESSGTTMTEDDAIVMDALSQSLGRSTESIRSSTPMCGSLPNLHFVTSPKPPRCSSTNLSRAQPDASTPMSGSGIQLEFPDPLSTSNESIGHAQEALVPDELPKQTLENTTGTALALPIVEQVVETTNATVHDAVGTQEIVRSRAAGNCVDEKPVMFESRSIHPPARVIPGHVALVSNMILNAASALGRRWAPSVVVSILALLIGATTYIGAPASVSTKVSSPSLASPTSSLWTTVYPSNKSNLMPTHLTSQTAISTMKDVPLSLVPSTSTRHVVDTAMRRAKRNLSPTICKSSKKVKPANDEAKLLIDGPLWGKGKRSVREVASISEVSPSTQGSSKSLHPQLTLPDPKSIRAVIANYLTPAPSTAYSTLSEDIATLMHALDELLVSINAQTASLANAVYRTREEVTYRHKRAKSNAKNIRKQGGEFLKGFKKTVARQAKASKTNAKELRLFIKDVAEGVKEGVSQSLKIKRRDAGKQTGEGSVAGLSRGFQRRGRKSKRAQRRAERLKMKNLAELSSYSVGGVEC